MRKDLCRCVYIDVRDICPSDLSVVREDLRFCRLGLTNRFGFGYYFTMVTGNHPITVIPFSLVHDYRGRKENYTQ